MNSLERIMSAVRGEKTDKHPYTLLLSLYGARLIESDTYTYYNDPERWFEGQLSVIETFDPDIIITPFSFPLEAEAFGCEMIYLNQYAPNTKKPIINTLEEIDQMVLPDYSESKSIQFFLRSTDLMHEHFGGEKAIASPIHSPADIPALLMGMEKWIDTLLFHPKAVEEMMTKTIAHFVRLGNEFFSRGATFLVIPVNFTSAMIITDHIFKKLIPYLEIAFGQLHGPIVIHNGGTKLMPFIQHFSKLPNVLGFVLEPSESYDEARSLVGNEVVLMGNIDGPNLINLSLEKAQKMTLEILNNRKDDRHFIFASSNADIPYETPVETIRCIVDTIRNFNKQDG